MPLDRQDSGRWDTSLIAAAETLLHRASEMNAIGRYQLEAALQSAHVHRRRSGVANWRDVVRLYDALLGISDSPVVAINRALAIGEVDGARAGLAALPAADERLIQYQPFWAARAALLAKTDATADARHAYDVAIGLERDASVRRFLQTASAKLRS